MPLDPWSHTLTPGHCTPPVAHLPTLPSGSAQAHGAARTPGAPDPKLHASCTPWPAAGRHPSPHGAPYRGQCPPRSAPRPASPPLSTAASVPAPILVASSTSGGQAAAFAERRAPRPQAPHRSRRPSAPLLHPSPRAAPVLKLTHELNEPARAGKRAEPSQSFSSLWYQAEPS